MPDDDAKDRRRFEVSMITMGLDHEKRIARLEKGELSVAVREEVTSRFKTQSGNETPITQRPLSELSGKWKALAAAIAIVIAAAAAGVASIVKVVVEALR